MQQKRMAQASIPKVNPADISRATNYLRSSTNSSSTGDSYQSSNSSSLRRGASFGSMPMQQNTPIQLVINDQILGEAVVPWVDLAQGQRVNTTLFFSGGEMMHLTIIRKNGKRYKLSQGTGYHVLYFRPDSIKVNSISDKIDGRPGNVNSGTEVEGRTIRTSIVFEAYDFPDYALKRNEFFQILDSREDFYVIYSEEPGKRWLVKANQFTPEPLTRVWGAM
ncbi:phage tail domain-containing protein [Bacillus cereus]